MDNSTLRNLSAESALPERAISVANDELKHTQRPKKEARKSATSDSVSITRKMVSLVLYDNEPTLSEKTPVVTSPIETTTELQDPTFTPFPELPPELRLRIWHFTAKDPEPRTVTLTLAKKTVNGKVIGYLKTVTPSPPLLHTCHDSREEASKNYTKAFKSLGENGEVVEMAYVVPLLNTIIVHLPDWFHLAHGTPRNGISTTSPWQPTTHSMVEVHLKRSADSGTTSKRQKCLAVFPRLKVSQSQMWASIEPWASEFFGEDYYIWDYSPPRHFMWAVARWHAFWFSQLAVVEYTNQFYVDFHHDGRNDERHDMVTLRVMDPNGEWMKDIMLPPFVLE